MDVQKCLPGFWFSGPYPKKAMQPKTLENEGKIVSLSSTWKSH